MINDDRVRIWNSFFHQARAEVLRLKRGDPAKAEFEPKGGRLTEEQQSILTVLVLCTLAIEARANHMILEQAEIGKLSKDEAYAAQRLPTLEKWILLPRLVGKRALVKTDSGPHQAIAEICKRRNALVHVIFDKVTEDLPNKAKTISLFKSFVYAMEDMNVKLMRGVSRPRKSVLKLADI